MFWVNIIWRSQGNSEADEQTGAVPTEPKELTAFSLTLEFEGKFLLDLSPFFLCFEALQALFGICLKALSFLLRPCFVCNYSFGTLA